MRGYIERTVVIDLLERYGATDDAIALINTIPADDDIVEIKHGKWFHLSKGDLCSECGFQTGRYESGRNYCPMCGAHMDKED